MSVITGTVIARFDNKQTKNGPRQLVEVQLPGHAEKIGVWGKPGELDAFYVNGQINVEQKGQYWNLAKDQPAPTGSIPHAPATPPTGNGYTPPAPASKEAMIAWASTCTDVFMHILNKVTLSPEMTGQDFVVQEKTAVTIYIATMEKYKRP